MASRPHRQRLLEIQPRSRPELPVEGEHGATERQSYPVWSQEVRDGNEQRRREEEQQRVDGDDENDDEYNNEDIAIFRQIAQGLM